jgi:hypothetical protein
MNFTKNDHRFQQQTTISITEHRFTTRDYIPNLVHLLGDENAMFDMFPSNRINKDFREKFNSFGVMINYHE